MAATSRDETLSRSIMFLCMGVAFLLFIQWYHRRASQPGMLPDQTNRPTTASATKLIVDLSDRRVYLYQKQLLASYPIAVGQTGWETPIGSFQIIQMQQNPAWVNPITGQVIAPGATNPLGKRWVGFWSDGRSAIGFHGTAEEALIGQAVSHGCLRMRNRDITALYRQVGIGTSVTVRP